MSLLLVTPIKSTPTHPTSARSALILSIHLRLGLPSGFHLSGFLTNGLRAFLFSPIGAAERCQFIVEN
jgi:hypothetical protein